MQDIYKVNNKLGAPLIALALVEMIVSHLPIILAAALAILHAVMLYVYIVAAVKEAHNNTEWFPTMLFRNMTVVTLAAAALMAIFDPVMAGTAIIAGGLVYIAPLIVIRIPNKQPGNGPVIIESTKYRNRIGYEDNCAVKCLKTQKDTKQLGYSSQIIDVSPEE